MVAVIAYTGYDMEDACIVNKSAYERGFGHASVYKCHVIDLQDGKPAADLHRFVFDNTYKKGEQVRTYIVGSFSGQQPTMPEESDALGRK